MNGLLLLATDSSAWAALVALLAMEIILGIDNLVFVAILTNKVEESRRAMARLVGIGLALVLRLIFLGFVAYIVRLTAPIITLHGHAFSWRDLIMLAGGLFLVWKATQEIRHHVEHAGAGEDEVKEVKYLSFYAAIVQIVALDVVFSIDSIVTAVGMTDQIAIMVIAVILSIGLMLIAADRISKFIEKNQTVVMLALSFLLMIGMTLIAEGFGAHVEKGYIYAAMAFSTVVEGLNIFARRKRKR